MPKNYFFIWDISGDVEGNVRHLAEHGLTPEDAEQAFALMTGMEISESSGLPIVFGPAMDGQMIVVVYEAVDEFTIYVVTAYHI